MMKKTLLSVTLITTALASTPLLAKDHRSHKGCEKAAKSQKMLERTLTADQVWTLAEARLLKRGNDNLKVGSITENDDGFVMTIVTRDDSLVKEVELARNGMPKEKFERIQKRMKKRQEKNAS